jgi:hypothetical protein
MVIGPSFSPRVQLVPLAICMVQSTASDLSWKGGAAEKMHESANADTVKSKSAAEEVMPNHIVRRLKPFVPVTRAGHTWWINFRANDLFLACSGFEQRVLSDHFDEATMTIDCRTARILSHRQNIQPYGRLLATQPMS